MRNVRLWVGCLLIALLATACGGDSVFSLEVGDCFDDPSSYATEVETVDKVSCSESHDNEVYAVGDHPAGGDASYSGAETLDAYSFGYCLSEFESYVGIPYEDSRLDLAYFYPTREGWEDDDREVACFLYDYNLAKLTGSMKGSRE